LNQKQVVHYNTPGHAHELTFSCYHQRCYLEPIACEYFLHELEKSRVIYRFKIWAYVVMPTHVHLLIWPQERIYYISKIESGLKGIMSKKYSIFLNETDKIKHKSLLIQAGKRQKFTFWQPGSGFDRNLWNPKAIHDSIRYIEANPVRAGFVSAPEEWKWSSAYARKYN